MGRDIYADLAKIEERGKRKKKKGILSFMDKGTGEESSSPKPVHTVAAMSSEPKPVASEPEPPKKPEEWKPLTGRELKIAKDKLLNYKRNLEKAYKSGRMSKEQCRERAKLKEIELGLAPPE